MDHPESSPIEDTFMTEANENDQLTQDTHASRFFSADPSETYASSSKNNCSNATGPSPFPVAPEQQQQLPSEAELRAAILNLSSLDLSTETDAFYKAEFESASIIDSASMALLKSSLLTLDRESDHVTYLILFSKFLSNITFAVEKYTESASQSNPAQSNGYSQSNPSSRADILLEEALLLQNFPETVPIFDVTTESDSLPSYSFTEEFASFVVSYYTTTIRTLPAEHLRILTRCINRLTRAVRILVSFRAVQTQMISVLHQIAHAIKLIETASPNQVDVKSLVGPLNNDHTEELIPLHVDFLGLCIMTKSYTVASIFIKANTIQLIPKKSGVTAVDVMLYYYYCALVSIGLQSYAKALQYFQLVFAVPSMALTNVVIEAYKKLILVSLLHHGNILNGPKFLSPQVIRKSKPSCMNYIALADHFTSENANKMQELVEKHRMFFEAENNLGLAKKVVKALHRRLIQRLTKTFFTLSLDDIAQKVSLTSAAEAEKVINSMIVENEIRATIDQRAGMVQFHEMSEVNDFIQGEDDGQSINIQTEKCLARLEQIAAFRDELAVDKTFVMNQVRADQDRRVGQIQPQNEGML